MVRMGPSAYCQRCGNPFMQGRLGRPGKFCGRTCRQRYYEEHRALAALAYTLHHSLLTDAYRRRLLLPLLRAAGGDTSLTQNAAAPDPEAEGCGESGS